MQIGVGFGDVIYEDRAQGWLLRNWPVSGDPGELGKPRLETRPLRQPAQVPHRSGGKGVMESF
jgi:hypothetical protein